eukprot:69754-Pyramimonas_sp.AAC.1
MSNHRRGLAIEGNRILGSIAPATSMSPLSRAAVALSPHRAWSGVVSGVGCPRLKRKLRPLYWGWCAACEAMKRC